MSIKKPNPVHSAALALKAAQSKADLTQIMLSTEAEDLIAAWSALDADEQARINAICGIASSSG